MTGSWLGLTFLKCIFEFKTKNETVARENKIAHRSAIIISNSPRPSPATTPVEK